MMTGNNLQTYDFSMENLLRRSYVSLYFFSKDPHTSLNSNEFDEMQVNLSFQVVRLL